jgi:hypothetical protein
MKTSPQLFRLALAPVTFLIVSLAGCTSVGSVGLMVKSGANPLDMARAGSFRDLGYVEATDCRYLIIGILPLGNADPGHVLEKALSSTGADALLNVSTSNSHYGFVPIYNVFSINCTSLRGTAIKFETTRPPS